MHHILVRDIRVGEIHLFNRLLVDERFHVLLFIDGDAVGIELPGELRRILPAGYLRYLRSCESYDLVSRVITEKHVEVVKFAELPEHQSALSRPAAPSIKILRIMSHNLIYDFYYFVAVCCQP